MVKCQIGTTDSAGDSRGLAARVDADADICYCEAKHVQQAAQFAVAVSFPTQTHDKYVLY